MKAYVLFWEEIYEGQQIIGVYASREDAEKVLSVEFADDESYYVVEMEMGKTYGFSDVRGGKATA